MRVNGELDLVTQLARDVVQYQDLCLTDAAPVTRGVSLRGIAFTIVTFDVDIPFDALSAV